MDEIGVLMKENKQAVEAKVMETKSEQKDSFTQVCTWKEKNEELG